MLSVVAAVLVLCAVCVAAFALPELGRSNAYAEATSLYEAGAYAEAQAAYEKLGDYRDASQQATLCGKHVCYQQAVALMDAGDYEHAHDAFMEILGFQDATERAEECKNITDYAAAEALLAEGAFYDAYRAFSALDAYEDASERAAFCVQPAPATGELYHHPDYVSSASEVAITAAAAEDDRYYMKVYQGDVLVSTLFFRDASAVTVGLPAGSYQLRVANGNEWFGETDLFGSAGVYSVLEFEDGSSEMSVEAGYHYDLSIEMSVFFGSGKTVDRSAF